MSAPATLEPKAEQLAALAAFDRIPPCHDVATLRDLVVVYSESGSGSLLEDGGIYVIEHQRPRSGMSWEAFGRLQSRRLEVRREVVRVFQRPERTGDLWWYAHAYRSGPFADGPMEEFNLADMIVGKVVGIYKPPLAH